MEEEEGLKGINAIQQLKIYLLSKSHMTGMTLLTMLRLTLIAFHLYIANIKHLTSCSYSTPFVFSKDINTVRKKSVVGFFPPYYFLP